MGDSAGLVLHGVLMLVPYCMYVLGIGVFASFKLALLAILVIGFMGVMDAIRS